MHRRLGQWSIVILLVIATGGHWALLQSFAWVGMAVSYSQSDTLPVALKKTFDGAHPCTLCKFVAEGKKSEKRGDFLKVETKLDLFSSGSSLAIFPPALGVVLRSDIVFGPVRTEPPPGPPPRRA